MKILQFFFLLFSTFGCNIYAVEKSEHPNSHPIKDTIITNDGKQLLGKLRKVPSLKFSFCKFSIDEKDISLVIYHKNANKMQYITNQGFSYLANADGSSLLIDSIDKEMKLDLAKLVAIFTNKEYAIAKNQTRFPYLVTLKNGDQFTGFLSPNSFNESFLTNKELEIKSPYMNSSLSIQTETILSLTKLEPSYSQVISNTLSKILKENHLIKEHQLTSVGVSWKNVKDIELVDATTLKERECLIALGDIQNEEFNEKVSSFSYAPGLNFEGNNKAESFLALEDFDSTDIDANEGDDIEIEQNESDYIFYSNNDMIEQKKQLIALNDSEETLHEHEKKIISINEFKQFLRDTAHAYEFGPGEDSDPVTGISSSEAQKFAEWKNKILVIRGEPSTHVELGMLVESVNAVEWIADDHNKLPPSTQVEKIKTELLKKETTN